MRGTHWEPCRWECAGIRHKCSQRSQNSSVASESSSVRDDRNSRKYLQPTLVSSYFITLHSRRDSHSQTSIFIFFCTWIPRTLENPSRYWRIRKVHEWLGLDHLVEANLQFYPGLLLGSYKKFVTDLDSLRKMCKDFFCYTDLIKLKELNLAVQGKLLKLAKHH